MSKGKSVVVNYDDKAFLFNVSAGETVDRMQTRLSEVYSIPVDQQQLFVASPQKFQHKDKDLSNIPASVESKVDFFKDFNVTEFPFLPKVFETVDYFILDLRPTLSSLLNRKVVLEYVKKTLSKCLGARAFCVGSSMNNVFLPDEMMEVTPFLCKGQEEKWVLRVNEGLCSAAFSSTESGSKGPLVVSNEDDAIDDSKITVNSVTFDCKSSCVLANINNMNVKISQNQLEALYNGALLEDINFICKKSSLFKKSLLLIKSWCSYDSKQFSPNGKTVYPDVLPPFVLDIMVVHIISRYGDAIEHPLHTLGLFLQFFAFVDFKSVIITMTDLLSVDTLEPLIDDELQAIKDQKLSNEINMKYRVLFNGYRHRYEATVTANRRAKEESVTVAESIAQNTSDGAAMEEAIEKNKSTGISWGFTSENPSLTVDFKPSLGIPGGVMNNGMHKDDKNRAEAFPKSFMNVIGPFKPSTNIASHLQASDTLELTSLLQCGLKRFEQTMHTCRLAASNPNGCVDMGEGVEISIENYFIGECFGLSRDKVVVEKKLHDEINRSDADAIEELRMSKYYCEVESPEDVLRHAELIMGSKITADAVANLIVHIIEQMGPLPIGEIGKLLQEFTGNQNLSRILKSQFRGLKKLIEGYPSSLMVGGDHNFNPHVYLARTKAPAAPDPWIDEKKVNISQDMMVRETVPPPALQVQHEQQKARTKSQNGPPALPPSTRAAPTRDDTAGNFQLSASSPAFVAPANSNGQSNQWREPQSHNGRGRNSNPNISRDTRLPTTYYADDRIEATETAFLSNDHYKSGVGGGDDNYHSRPLPRGGSDIDDRAPYANRGTNYHRGGDSDSRVENQYRDSLSQHPQSQQPPEKPRLSSLPDFGHPGLDEEYASSHFNVLPSHNMQHMKKYTPADYIDGLSNSSGPNSGGRYVRDARSSRDGNVSSIFAGDYARPNDRYDDRHGDKYNDRHEFHGDRRVDRQGDRYNGDRHGDRHGDRVVDRHSDNRLPDRNVDRHGDRHVEHRHLDPFYTSVQGHGLHLDSTYADYSRGGGGGGGGSGGRHGDRGGAAHYYPPPTRNQHGYHSQEEMDYRGQDEGGSSSSYRGTHSPVDSNMLPYFLRDT